MTEKKTNTGELPFEKALEQLEGLVEKMEEGDLPLDKMIACFEQGCALSKQCRQKLDQLEKKIQLLLKDDGEEGKWGDFNDASSRTSASLNDSNPEPEKSSEDSLF